MVLRRKTPGDSFGLSINSAGVVTAIQPDTAAAAASLAGMLRVGDDVLLVDGRPPEEFWAHPERWSGSISITIRVRDRTDRAAQATRAARLRNYAIGIGFLNFSACIAALAIKVCLWQKTHQKKTKKQNKKKQRNRLRRNKSMLTAGFEKPHKREGGAFFKFLLFSFGRLSAGMLCRNATPRPTESAALLVPTKH